MVLTCDLLEDRCIDDVIITNSLLFYIGVKQIDCILRGSVTPRILCQDVVRTSGTPFFFYHNHRHFNSDLRYNIYRNLTVW